MAHNHIEIERSWILKALPDSALIDHSIYHEIGYLFNEDGELRVYKKNLAGRWKYGITVKTDGKLSRQEWEDKAFPEWAFNVVWPNTLGARVHKVRYFVHYSHDGNIYLLEIDEYRKNCKGLIRLECEFRSEEAANRFVLPNWAKGSVEVTKDSRYKNKNLAALTRQEYRSLRGE